MENLVALILIAFGTALGLLILWKLLDVVRNSMSKNKQSIDEKKFDRLAKAFIQHRKDIERRMQNIEAIVTGNSESAHELAEQGDSPLQKELAEADYEDDQQMNSQSGKLPNMLKKQRNQS